MDRGRLSGFDLGHRPFESTNASGFASAGTQYRFPVTRAPWPRLTEDLPPVRPVPDPAVFVDPTQAPLPKASEPGELPYWIKTITDDDSNLAHMIGMWGGTDPTIGLMWLLTGLPVTDPGDGLVWLSDT